MTTDRASTGGVSFVDVNGDGYADIYVTNGYDVSQEEPQPQPNRFYANHQGRFVVEELGLLTAIDGFSSGSAWADYDNDGDLDTFIANQRDQANALLIRQADAANPFARMAEPLLAEDLGWSYSVAAADIDNDRFVDIFVSNGGLSHTGVNAVYRNIGGERLEALRDSALSKDEQGSGGASFSDYDLDGDQDLVVANRTPPASGGYKLALFRNDGNFAFSWREERALDGDAELPMSVAWGDIDNDGDQDLYVGNLFGVANSLYENRGDGTFVQRAGGRATTDGGSSYAVLFGDLDNDADLDLLVANWGAASEVYLNDGAGSFEPVAAGAFPLAIDFGASAALADFDLDGDLDMLIGNWPNAPGPGREENALIENRYAQGGWLRVTLEGVTSNASAIGARVELVHHIDGREIRQVREVRTQEGWRSQCELTQHFGLGRASRIDRLTVYWPSGVVQSVTPPRVNQTITVRESASP